MDDCLVNNISALCSLDKRFHGKKRELELKSLTRYLRQFKNFSLDEFVSFVCRQYIECLRARKRFCSQSIYNRVSAIQSRLDITVLTRRRYNSILKNLRKLFNPYNDETNFYTNTGTLIQIPPQEFRQLRENAKYLIELNNTNVPDRWQLNTYTDAEIEIVYRYFKLNLDNFLTSTTTTPIDVPFLELCMLIVFNYNTPRRISEITQLTLSQVEQLILHNTLNIKSKDGFSIDCIYISVALADTLNRFVMKLYPDIFTTNTSSKYPPDFKIFKHSYKMYYTRMRNTLKSLIGEDRLKNLRIFHGFRNFYANKHLSADTSKECQHILGHQSAKMTRRYAQRQKQCKQFQMNEKAKVLKYLNQM